VHIVDLSESLITGCRDTQTSADARIDGTFHGALTYYLVAAIRELGAEASYRQIHARTLEMLDGEYEQVPQLEGRKAHLDSPFLSVRA
jgi:metacaspase-1